MNAFKGDWRQLQNILILLLVFAFCLYVPSLFYDGFADDDVYLAFANRFLRESHWSDLHQFFLRPANPIEFLPLRDLSYWLDFRLYGDELNGFHATNLLWYAASGLATFWLFRELILLCRPAWAARKTVLSLCGAVVFVVHPAHVEVVAWIASRKDLIGGTLGFIALALLTRALRHHWSGRQMVLAAVMLFAACFGKASAMTGILLVTVLIGMEWSRRAEVRCGKKLGFLLLFWILVGVAFVIHLNVGASSGIRIENHPGLLATLDRASRIFAALTGILLFPYPMRFYYDVYQLGEWHWLVSASAALLLIASLCVLWRKRSLWALGVAMTFAPFIVYLQLMPFTSWSLASERFVYASVAGLALVLIDLFGRIDRPKEFLGLLLVIVLPCAVIAWSRIGEWGDFPKQLLFREYASQPDFHNAIRDRIVFKLLPEERYAEAAALAGQVQRTYATAALFSLIEAEQAYRQMSEAKSLSFGDNGGVLKGRFCDAVARLRSATRDGYAQMPNEPDVSYNNILRTLDQQLNFRYGAGKSICVGVVSRQSG